MPVETRRQARARGENIMTGATPTEAVAAANQFLAEKAAPSQRRLEEYAARQGIATAEAPENLVAANAAAETMQAAQAASDLVDMAQEPVQVDFEPNPIAEASVSRSIFGNVAPGMGQIATGAQIYSQGLAQQAAAGAAAADFEAQALGEAAEQMAEQNQQAAEQLERLNLKMQEIGDKAMNLNTRLSELKIDPNRFWNSRTTAQKAMLMIGAGLVGSSGGDGIGMIMGFIDRDVAAQQEEYNRMGGEVKNMVSIMSQLYGPGKDAVLMARSFALETLKAQVEARIATTKSPQIRAEGLKAIGMFEVEIGKLHNQVAMDSLNAELKMEESAKLGAQTQLQLQALDQAEQALNSLERTPRSFLSANNAKNREAMAVLRDAMVGQAGMDESSFSQLMGSRFFDNRADQARRLQAMRAIIEQRKARLTQAQGRVLPASRQFELPRF